MAHPAIQGKWMPADTSKNTLEVAPTEREEIFAVRDSYSQGEVIFATGTQLKNLAETVQKGRIQGLR